MGEKHTQFATITGFVCLFIFFLREQVTGESFPTRNVNKQCSKILYTIVLNFRILKAKHLQKKISANKSTVVIIKPCCHAVIH